MEWARKSHDLRRRVRCLLAMIERSIQFVSGVVRVHKQCMVSFPDDVKAFGEHVQQKKRHGKIKHRTCFLHSTRRPCLHTWVGSLLAERRRPSHLQSTAELTSMYEYLISGRTCTYLYAGNQMTSWLTSDGAHVSFSLGQLLRRRNAGTPIRELTCPVLHGWAYHVECVVMPILCHKSRAHSAASC